MATMIRASLFVATGMLLLSIMPPQSPVREIPELFRADFFPVAGSIVYFDPAVFSRREFRFSLRGETMLAREVVVERDGEEWRDEFSGGEQRSFRVAGAGTTSFIGKYGVVVTGMIFDKNDRRFSIEGIGNALKITPVPTNLPLHCEEGGAPPEPVLSSQGSSGFFSGLITTLKFRAVEFGITRIRVLKLDDSRVVQASAGGDAVFAHHLAFIAASNAALFDSNVKNVRFVLAGVRVAPFAPLGSKDATLQAMRLDGEVERLRREVDADLVGFRAPLGAGNGGFSPEKESEFVPENGFFMYEDFFALESGTAQHEIGHPLGLHHNSSKRGGIPAGGYEFNNAWRDPENAFATLMSVEAGPDGSYPPRIFEFSCDGGLYHGKPTGNPSANNARMAAIGAEYVKHYHERL